MRDGRSEGDASQSIQNGVYVKLPLKETIGDSSKVGQ